MFVGSASGAAVVSDGETEKTCTWKTPVGYYIVQPSGFYGGESF